MASFSLINQLLDLTDVSKPYILSVAIAVEVATDLTVPAGPSHRGL
jgi:hypothetical protein